MHFKKVFAANHLLLALALLMAGCSSMMQKTKLVEHLEPDVAMVNFVRPHIFANDGLDFDLWDGDKFIGVLGAGTMLQYKTHLGQHVFMAKGRSWTYVKADLAGGQQYFIKSYLVPSGIPFSPNIVLASIEAQKVPDISSWLTYEPRELVAGKSENYSAGKKDEAEKALKEFNEGRTSGGELKPENGVRVGK